MEDSEVALLIGRLEGKMDSVQTTVLALHGEIKSVSTDMQKLPCKEHSSEILNIKQWMSNCKLVNAEATKAKWNLRTELYKGGLIIIGGLITLLMTWLMNGRIQ